jgi:hypothetical protein
LPPAKPKTDDDYGIDEVTEADTSDDDEKPKKKVPEWASSKFRKKYPLLVFNQSTKFQIEYRLLYYVTWLLL